MNLRKYLQVFKSNWQVDFEYRFNFILGRVQNILVLFALFFLWKSVFRQQEDVFGYSNDQIFTYVILSHVVRNIVLETRAKFVGEEIQNGYLSSILVKPVNYLAQSFSEDLARRIMNILTAIFEVTIFVAIAQPPLSITLNPKGLGLFLLSLILAIVLHYILSFTAAISAFWTEQHWGPSFLTEVLMMMFSGALFPLDALPPMITAALKLLPFYYIVFFPVSVYLGRVTGVELAQGIGVMISWAVTLWLLYRYIWRKGLTVYQAYGG